MPIYEYACKKCEHVFDVLQKMSDEPLTYCPECGAPELRKLISAPSFRLKGGGWYETDFKQGDNKAAVEALKRALRLLGRGVPSHSSVFVLLLLWELLLKLIYLLMTLMPWI